jgi:leucyl/phenylalanyl-tRNA--protein transferase
MPLVQLHPDYLDFPPAEQALDDPPGLLAIGGDLSPERLLEAYSQGIFPWFDDESPILWWSPDPRMTLKPSEVHVSRSMRKLMRQQQYRVRLDHQFEQVIEHCALRPVRHNRDSGSVEEAFEGAFEDTFEDTWITADIQQAYITLHEQGYAHSVEIYDLADRLIGGLYGISLGRMFFGESMFSLAPNASKLAFISLANLLQHWNFTCIDCQLPTEHLASLGATPQSRTDFLQSLTANNMAETRQGSWAAYAEFCKPAP